MSLYGRLDQRINKMLLLVELQQSARRLPMMIVDSDTGETLYQTPDNPRFNGATRKMYIDLDIDEDGSEP